MGTPSTINGHGIKRKNINAKLHWEIVVNGEKSRAGSKRSKL